MKKVDALHGNKQQTHHTSKQANIHLVLDVYTPISSFVKEQGEVFTLPMELYQNFKFK